MTDAVLQRATARLVRLPGAGFGPRLKLWAGRVRRAERHRRELNGLSDRELGDIGLSRCHINVVANVTFSR
jgi:uncharacterized protein YjiS (DUF1127 family)